MPALAGDPIARPKAVDFFADRHHNAGRVRAWHVRERGPHLVASADHQIVHVADGGGMDLDQHLMGSWTRFRRFADS
jgi:hypothetical protein